MRQLTCALDNAWRLFSAAAGESALRPKTLATVTNPPRRGQPLAMGHAPSTSATPRCRRYGRLGVWTAVCVVARNE